MVHALDVASGAAISTRKTQCEGIPQPSRDWHLHEVWAPLEIAIFSNVTRIRMPLLVPCSNVPYHFQLIMNHAIAGAALLFAAVQKGTPS